MNSFGTLFRITLWGESHGPQVGVTLDGVPAGLPLDIPDFEADLARRRSGVGYSLIPFGIIAYEASCVKPIIAVS